MNYPAASYGVSIGSYHNASRGGESNLYPPQEGLSAFGGLKFIKRKKSKLSLKSRQVSKKQYTLPKLIGSRFSAASER
jgi:hypothetical protein